MTHLLAIGHVARDEFSDGAWRLGGGALYGAVTAARLGRGVALLTRVGPAERDALAGICREEGIELHALPSLVTTTFAIVYETAGRKLTLRARARGIGRGDVPPDLKVDGAPSRSSGPAAVVLAPIAHELSTDLFASVPGTRVLAAQGLLREWSADGTVSPRRWAEAEPVLARSQAVAVVSDEDLGGDLSIAERWSAAAQVVVTLGERGACLYEGGAAHHVAGFAAREVVDPTGAGDAFAVALALALAEGQDLRAAVRYANAVASFAVEGAGIAGLADAARVDERLRA